jgi:hypothetical protein
LMHDTAPAAGHLLMIGLGASVLIGIMLYLMRRFNHFLALKVIT